MNPKKLRRSADAPKPETAATPAEKAKAKYRCALRKYFADNTTEGGIAKYYYANGVRDTAVETGLASEAEMKAIYDEEYWRFNGEPAANA